MVFSIKSFAMLSMAFIVVSGVAAAVKGDHTMSTLRNLSHGGKKGGKGGKRGHCHHDHHHQQSGHHQLYFDFRLEEGTNKTVLENGPMIVFASCDDGGASLVLNMESNTDTLVFGDTTDDSNLDDPPLVNQVLPAGVLLERDLWTQSSNDQGNDINDGAVWANGRYIGWNGDSTIGIHRSNSTELILAGSNVNCIIAGVLNFAGPDFC